MESQAIQPGQPILKAMPINQKTNLVPTEHFNIGEKMPGLISVQRNQHIKMTGMGKMVDIDG